MKLYFEKPAIDITFFEQESIMTDTTSPYISQIQTRGYGMQNYTTLQKVSHDIMEGNPTVEAILKYQVN